MLLGHSARPNEHQITAPALYHRRTRSIETFTQTVTEVWIGNHLSRILATDTTKHVETKQEFISTYSTHEPLKRELSTSTVLVQREYQLG